MRKTPNTFRLQQLATPIQLAVLALCASAAQAQVAAPASAASQPEGGLSTVTVTATKRSTSLQRTPVAVTSLNASDLDKAHVQTIQDVVNLVPSFQATGQGDHGVITMTLRGIGNDSAKTEYADPEVAMFVDGIYAPRAEGAAALLFDMEGIEVLRGPQGTLWGRNSTVGAVNMQTAKPVLGDKFGQVELGLGDYNRSGLRGAFNVPLSDTAALRFSFAHEQHDGYVDYQRAPQLDLASQQAAAAPVIADYNANHPDHPIAFQPINPNLFVQGGPKYSAQNQTAARVSLFWKPTVDTRWNLSYEQFQDRGTASMNLAQTPRAGEKFWSALIDVAPSVKRDAHTLRSRFEYAVSEDLSLAYVAGISRFTGASDFDQDGGATVPTSFTTGATFQQDRTNYSQYINHSHELTLQSTGTQQVDWILGAYYAAEDNSIRFDIPIMNGTQQGTVGWQGSFIQPKETVRSTAAFGQATWNVSHDLHLTGGLRYTQDKRANIGGTNNGWSYDDTLPQVPVDPGNGVLTPGSGFSTYQHNDGSYSGSKATWLARINYDVSKDFMAYASVSTGYKSGGLQDGGRPYGAENLSNYEIGTKNTFMDGKVRFNNAVYYQNFKDFQFSAPVTNPDGSHSLATSNSEGAKVGGFESELAAKLTPDDKVQLTFAYTKTKLGKLIAGSNDYALPACSVPGISTCIDVTGHALPHAPKFALQAQYEHQFHLADGDTLSPRISLHHETASWLSVFNLGDGDRQAAYSRADVGLRYASKKDWYVDAFVRNVSDTKVKTSAQNSFGVWQSQYLPPRTIGVNVGLYF
jgi:iron complex outermembrane recepter protein